MNDDILKGKWNQVKGEVRRTWGELTDDDVTRADGDTDVLIGQIQERYGIARDKASAQVRSFVERFVNAKTEHPGTPGTAQER